MHRADLHDALKDLAQETTKGEHHGTVSVEVGQKVVDINCEQGILTLDTDVKTEKDLLVIADGAHVTQRVLVISFLTNAIAEPAFCSIYRPGGSDQPYRKISVSRPASAVPDRQRIRDCPILQQLAHRLVWDVLCTGPSRNTLLVTYPCREGSVLNIAIVHDTARSATENPDAKKSWQASASRAEALKLLHNFHPDL